MKNRQANASFYSVYKNFDLTDNISNRGGTGFGWTIVNYSIYKHTDVSNLDKSNGYFIYVKQRIVIPNSNIYKFGASNIHAYKDYPAILVNKINLNVNNSAKITLLGMYPRTLNSSITESSTSQSGNTTSTNHSSSSGSSFSNVNTFGVSVGGGLYGPVPMGMLTLSYSHSWDHSTSSNTSDGSAQSQHLDNSLSDAMSIKDWSAYSQVSQDHESISWAWGQTYPWNVILYNQSKNGTNIDLPQFVQDRMMNNGLILPPSELALFGIDFTSHASWRVDFPTGIKENEIMKVSHTTDYYTASHYFDGGTLYANLQSSNDSKSVSYSLGDLDLSLYSISPLSGYPGDGPSTIGFRVNDFVFAPTQHTDTFKIVSRHNDLQVTGTGFDSIMVSTFKSNPKMDISFKIDNSYINYMLILTHWVIDESNKSTGYSVTPVTINWTVNNKYTGNSIIEFKQDDHAKFLNTEISLRDLNYESVNFHDYLVLGFNTISINILPDSDKNIKYNLSSITIR